MTLEACEASRFLLNLNTNPILTLKALWVSMSILTKSTSRNNHAVLTIAVYGSFIAFLSVNTQLFRFCLKTKELAQLFPQNIKPTINSFPFVFLSHKGSDPPTALSNSQFKDGSGFSSIPWSGVIDGMRLSFTRLLLCRCHR